MLSNYSIPESPRCPSNQIVHVRFIQSAGPAKRPGIGKSGEPFGKTGSATQLTVSSERWLTGVGRFQIRFWVRVDVYRLHNAESIVSVVQHAHTAVSTARDFYLFIHVSSVPANPFLLCPFRGDNDSWTTTTTIIIIVTCRFRTNEFSRRVTLFPAHPVPGAVDLYPFSHIPAARATSTGGGGKETEGRI